MKKLTLLLTCVLSAVILASCAANVEADRVITTNSRENGVTTSGVTLSTAAPDTTDPDTTPDTTAPDTTDPDTTSGVTVAPGGLTPVELLTPADRSDVGNTVTLKLADMKACEPNEELALILVDRGDGSANVGVISGYTYDDGTSDPVLTVYTVADDEMQKLISDATAEITATVSERVTLCPNESMYLVWNIKNGICEYTGDGSEINGAKYGTFYYDEDGNAVFSVADHLSDSFKELIEGQVDTVVSRHGLESVLGYALPDGAGE